MSVNGKFTYTPPAGTVLTAGTGQTLSVSFTPSDTNDYLSAAASATINVDQAALLITWPNPADLTYGTALTDAQLDASANVAGTFTYTPAVGTMLPAGTSETLSVSFTPDNLADYSAGTATAKINVDKATPTITWPEPSNIYYGTALSGTQLDASASWTVGGVPTTVAGTLDLYAGAGNGFSRGDWSDTVGFVRADGYDRLHVGHGDREDQRQQARAHRYVGRPRGYHIWHGAFRHAVERDGERARHFPVHASAGHISACRHRPDSFGRLHAERHDRF